MKDLIKKVMNKVMNKEVISYLIFGVLATAVNLGAKYALLFTVLDAEDGFQLQLAVIISWIVACLFAYITNRKWVFESKSENILLEMAKFFGARLTTLGMEMLIMFIFVTALGLNSDMWVFIWTIVTQVLIIVGNYVLSKLFVFKNKKENKKEK